MKYDNKGQVALWKVQNGGGNSPVLRGNVYAHRDIKAGEELSITLWDNSSEHPKAPTHKGKLEDAFVKPAPKPEAPFDDSDLPF
jgi:hypothetical protein